MVRNALRYQTDAEYDAHFLDLFRQSVARRTEGSSAIVAELSGGMDSTSIVAISDRIRKEKGAGVAELLDTVSYYDEAEPEWDDQRYFTSVEALRGKTGIHIPVSFRDRTFGALPSSDSPRMFPGADSSLAIQERNFHDVLNAHGYRSILSGVGGDEVLGGVPNPESELADLLISGNLPLFIQHTVAWSISRRSSAMRTVAQTLRFVASLHFPAPERDSMRTPWLEGTGAAKRLGKKKNPHWDEGRLGYSPSQISNGRSWWSILDTLPGNYPGSEIRLEFRYPYMDRDLIEFLFSIPHEQLSRPGQRRVLMRRSLAAILPPQVLGRRRKASISRGPLAALERSSPNIRALLHRSISEEYGLVNGAAASCGLDLALSGRRPDYWPGLFRFALFELWLRHLHGHIAAPGSRPAVTLPILERQDPNMSGNARSAGHVRKSQTER
jgi:asparagine synthase (glutamine-hydrolysing)